MTAERVDEARQEQLRCSQCHRRLADYVNKLERGNVLIEVRCRCGAVNSLTITR
jgi:hypothetical protein